MQAQLAPLYRMRLYAPGWLAAIAVAERSRLVLWLPVCMGGGVASYFSLRFEPLLWPGLTAASLSLLAALVIRLAWLRACLLPVAAVAIGFAAGQVATARAPPLETELPHRATTVIGTVWTVEMLPDGRRITLADVRLPDSGGVLHRHVRVRLKRYDDTPLATGDSVRVRALLRPPSPPTHPGGWDQQRDAFFADLGASGYALQSAERLQSAHPTTLLRMVQRLRETVAAHIARAIPGAAGAVCVTFLTGASMAIPEADHEAFRASGLAHLLAVAGLHIGIVMGFALAVARLVLALSVHASLYWPTKQIAALTALTAGGVYMVFTGMHVPIVRSFVMASLFTVALLAGRRAISVRGLGLAGVVLMLLTPYEVPGVSFQMSFSAVLALIAGYEALRPWLSRLHGRHWLRRFAGYLVALALTSALAGTASMPYGAYHFGHIQAYYVLANMVAVPLTALWVMPVGFIGLLLMPLGLDWLAFVPMGWGAEGVLWVARSTTALPAATIDVPHAPLWGLLILSFGLAWLGIWRSRLRLAGLLGIAIGVASPAWQQPPDLLLSADARLLGVRTAEGAFFLQAQGGTQFVADNWLQYWSLPAAGPLPKLGEAADGAIACTGESCLLRPRRAMRPALLVRGPARPVDCHGAAIVVSLEPARGLCPRPWPKLADRFTVWRDGAVAIWLTAEGARVLTDREARGSRPWVPPPPTPRPRPPPKLPAADTEGDD